MVVVVVVMILVVMVQCQVHIYCSGYTLAAVSSIGVVAKVVIA